MKLRKPRRRRRGRIEIIPMIDVMFFLLATFMLASLSLQNLHSLTVDLPRGRAAPLQASRAVTLTVTRDGAIFVNETAAAIDTLPSVLRPLISTEPDRPIVVNADATAPNGIVVQVMLRAREAGAQHFQVAIRRE